MKTPHSLLILTAALGLALTGCTSTSRVAQLNDHSLTQPFDEVPDTSLNGGRWMQLHPGNHREAVINQLGLPDSSLSPDLWVYPRAQSPNAADRRRGYDTLLVVFKGDHVSHLRLVNGSRVQEILAHQSRRPSPQAVFAALAE